MMESKELILQKIKENRPNLSELPEIPDFQSDSKDLDREFEKSLTKNHGQIQHVKNMDGINNFISKYYSKKDQICSLVNGVSGNIDISHFKEPRELKDVHLAILPGELGVSENAAIWLSEKNMVFRVLPFIIQHLIIVLDKNDLVENMHVAYQKIKIDEDGYGVFVAGPSKTADIEQNLVIGAHGARSLTVFLVG